MKMIFVKAFLGKWFSKIGTKTATIFAVLIALIALFIFLYFPPRQKAQAIKTVAAEANAIAEMTAYSIGPALFFEDMESVKEVLESVIQSQDIVYAVVLDDSGRMVAAFNIEKADQKKFANLEKGDYISPDGTIYEVIRSIQLNDREVGKFYFGISLEELNTQVIGSQAAIALVSLIILIIGIVSAFSISLVLTNPLTAMVKTVEQISAGNLTQRASVSSSDEVSRLAISFNRMVEYLVSTQLELENANMMLNERAKRLQQEINVRERAEEKITASLKEKEVLLKEIHHRVKNNLQVISSLLYLQSRNIKDDETLELFTESRARVKSMALIHEKLYRSADFSNVDFTEYIQDLIHYLLQTYNISGSNIDLQINVEGVGLTIESAVPCGLIINELVTNSLKYAFPNGRAGVLRIDLFSNKEKGGGDSRGHAYTLVVYDDGVGFSEDPDIDNAESIGLQLVTGLAEQLDGTVELDRKEGTRFCILFNG